MSFRRGLSWAGLMFLLVLSSVTVQAAEHTLLNASYDVSRELYKEINPAFVAAWEKKTGTKVTVNQAHAGSTKQALTVANGLEADVVTFNQPPDLDFLVAKKLLSADWRKAFPYDAAPYTTTSIFLVRKGNPKGIKDWDDLVKPGVSVVIPNPKTSGNGRYTYLAAWGYALEKYGSEDKAQDFVKRLFANVPVFDGGGRGATTTFTQRAVGDVLVTFENEATLVQKEIGPGELEVVYPSVSIEAAPPVAIVEPVAARHGTRELAKGYLDFLFGEEAQKIIARHSFRPRNEAILKANADRLPPIRTFRVEALIGDWATIQKQHFADGGIFDKITSTQ